MTEMIPGTQTKAGTPDNPATTGITAEHYIDKRSDGAPDLTVAINLADLGMGTRWEFDTIISIEDGNTIVLLFNPIASDEGWQRLDEVGEW